MKKITILWGLLAILEGMQAQLNPELDSLLRLYPNPASESATLSFPDVRTRLIELFQLDGKRIRSFGAHQGKELEINTASLAPGVYMLRVQEAGEVHSVKLIKL